MRRRLRFPTIACLARGAALLIVATPLLAANATAQPDPPPLPPIDGSSFPAQARSQIEAAAEAAQASPSDASLVGALAQTLHAWDEFDSAAAAYGRAQALAPRDVDWWYLGGLLSSRRGMHERAAEQFQRALDLQPDNGLIALRLADAALETGQLNQAAATYEPLTTRPETAPAAWYGVGRVRQARGDDGGAGQAYQKAVGLYPDFGAAHYALAQLRRKSGDRDGAKASLARQQQCLACWPMPADPWRRRLDEVRTDAAALLQRGVAAGTSTDKAAAEAIRLHEAAVAQNPALGQAHVNLIELYARTGNVARAEAHYRSASRLEGYEAEATRTWGYVLLQQRRADEAVPVLTEAVRLAPTNARALNGLGLALELSGQSAEAVEPYTQAVAAAPTARDIRFNLARTLVQLGRLPAAITELEQLRTPVDAETPRYLFALSAAQVRHGDRALGLKTGEEAARLATRFGLSDLAQAISRDLAALRAQVRP